MLPPGHHHHHRLRADPVPEQTIQSVFNSNKPIMNLFCSIGHRTENSYFVQFIAVLRIRPIINSQKS